jgi:16S rRNA G966 N2-methylase RsmD
LSRLCVEKPAARRALTESTPFPSGMRHALRFVVCSAVMDWKNKLYFGDNLDILRREVPEASVDLIYLDPPFNSNATYNVLFKEKSGEESAAQITAFEDT